MSMSIFNKICKLDNIADVKFKDVKFGDVFINHTGNYYMKTVEKIESGTTFEINTVDLETGKLYHFYSETPVKVVQAALHIDN